MKQHLATMMRGMQGVWLKKYNLLFLLKLLATFLMNLVLSVNAEGHDLSVNLSEGHDQH